jgi:periplasmic protein TonB
LLNSARGAVSSKDFDRAEQLLGTVRGIDPAATGIGEVAAAINAARNTPATAETPTPTPPVATPAAATPAAATPAPATTPPVASTTPAAAPAAATAKPATPAATPAASSAKDQTVQVTRRVEPEVPTMAIRRRINGEVQVEFTVTTDGKVADARILRSKPAKVFDQAALRAIQQWQFRPAIEGGQRVSKRVQQTFEFNVDDL